LKKSLPSPEVSRRGILLVGGRSTEVRDYCNWRKGREVFREDRRKEQARISARMFPWRGELRKGRGCRLERSAEKMGGLERG